MGCSSLSSATFCSPFRVEYLDSETGEEETKNQAIHLYYVDYSHPYM